MNYILIGLQLANLNILIILTLLLFKKGRNILMNIPILGDSMYDIQETVSYIKESFIMKEDDIIKEFMKDISIFIGILLIIYIIITIFYPFIILFTVMYYIINYRIKSKSNQ